MSAFEVVDNLFCRLIDKRQQSGDAALLPFEKDVVMIWHASGIIENGGFEYFFSQGIDALATAEAYGRVGMVECSNLLLLAASALPDNLAHLERAELQKVIRAKAEVLQILSERFWELDTRTAECLAAYISSHRS